MIRVELQDQAVQALLTRLGQAVSDLQPAMREIGQALTDRVSGTFKSSSDPWGQKWPSLSQSAILRRLKRNKRNFKKDGRISKRGITEATAGFRPLLDTGRLRGSITYRASKLDAEVGTKLIYAATHQFGRGPRGRWGKIPARPFMPVKGASVVLPHAWQGEVIDILQRRITEATR